MVQASRRKYHYIYKTVCSITGKFYIGMHSTDNLNDGYQGSGKILRYSVTKYGKENHHTEILEFLTSRQELKFREAQIINEDLLGNEDCMNLQLGGGDGWEYVHKNGAHKNGQKKAAEVYKKRLLEDSEFRARVKSKISENNKAAWKAGAFDQVDHATFAGKTHTDETKQKMREAALGKNVGEKNSQFGTRWKWVHKDSEAKRIPLSELEIYLSEGWILGQKPKAEKLKKIREKKITHHAMACARCGLVFEAYWREIERGRQFCSMACKKQK